MSRFICLAIFYRYLVISIFPQPVNLTLQPPFFSPIDIFDAIEISNRPSKFLSHTVHAHNQLFRKIHSCHGVRMFISQSHSASCEHAYSGPPSALLTLSSRPYSFRPSSLFPALLTLSSSLHSFWPSSLIPSRLIR